MKYFRNAVFATLVLSFGVVAFSQTAFDEKRAEEAFRNRISQTIKNDPEAIDKLTSWWVSHVSNNSGYFFNANPRIQGVAIESATAQLSLAVADNYAASMFVGKEPLVLDDNSDLSSLNYHIAKWMDNDHGGKDGGVIIFRNSTSAGADLTRKIMMLMDDGRFEIYDAAQNKDHPYIVYDLKKVVILLPGKGGDSKTLDPAFAARFSKPIQLSADCVSELTSKN